MSTTTNSAEQRVVLRNVRRDTYVDIVDDAESRGNQIAYDRGVVEITSPSTRHESSGRLIETFTEEQGISIRSVKSTTFRRAVWQRDFEAGESYHITHETNVRRHGDIDLAILPPPDLVIEIYLSRSSIQEFPIYNLQRAERPRNLDLLRRDTSGAHTRKQWRLPHTGPQPDSVRLPDCQSARAHQGH